MSSLARALEFVDTEPNLHGRSGSDDASSDTGVDTFTVGHIRFAHRCRPSDYHLSRDEVLPWLRCAAHVTVRPGETIALSGDAQRLVPATDRLWRLRDGHPRMPLSFSIRARKLI
jgi:hypothetical protein